MRLLGAIGVGAATVGILTAPGLAQQINLLDAKSRSQGCAKVNPRTGQVDVYGHQGVNRSACIGFGVISSLLWTAIAAFSVEAA